MLLENALGYPGPESAPGRGLWAPEPGPSLVAIVGLRIHSL